MDFARMMAVRIIQGNHLSPWNVSRTGETGAWRPDALSTRQSFLTLAATGDTVCSIVISVFETATKNKKIASRKGAKLAKIENLAFLASWRENDWVAGAAHIGHCCKLCKEE